jgi:hypothetical protein
MVANSTNAQLVLERTLLLSNYPSGSSIEVANNNFYIIGDDATHLLILNANYDKVDSIRLFKGDTRISKNKKPDIESSTMMSLGGSSNLLMMGSSSTKKREQLFIYNKSNNQSIESHSIKRFNKRLYSSGLKELNFEGLAATENNLIIANRGHLNNASNQLIVTDKAFWLNQKSAPIKILNLIINKETKAFAGISGLNYIPSKDMLLFTASTESTTDTYNDGEIGDSYIGWIANFSKRIESDEITADGLINLSENNQSFKKQKIESVTVQEVQGNSLILHFVADNDNGQSRLFKARLTF